MANETLATVTFLMVYSKETGILKINSVKARNIPMDISRAWGNRKNIIIRFTIKDWSCETQVKTLYRPLQELVWNESFSHKIKSKNMKQLQLYALVLDDTGNNIGEAMLNLDGMRLEDTTLYTLPIDSHSISTFSEGHLHFSVHPLKNTANIEILKGYKIRSCKEYTVQVSLQSTDNSEQKTTWQETPSWNEEIILEDQSVLLLKLPAIIMELKKMPLGLTAIGNDLRDDTLILKVIGKQTKEEQTVGEIRLHLSEVQHNEYGRFLPLQEIKENLVNFSTNFNPQNGTMVFWVHGLESLRSSSSQLRTSVYVQIKQMWEDRILKKRKTQRFPISENVSFSKSSLSFTIPTEQRKSTTFTLSIKTKKHFFSLQKGVIGRTVIGPLADGKWYKEFIQEKNTDLEHSLHFQL